MQLPFTTALSLVLAATTAGSPSSPSARSAGGQLDVGDVASYSFKSPMLNGLGLKSLDDLRGKPVLVAFWGSETWADDWVADILVWQREHGDDLAVIFAENPPTSVEATEAVTLKRRWIGTRAMWSMEWPIETGLVGVPSYGLLGVDGRLVKEGVVEMWGMSFPSRDMDEIEDAIAEQVRLRREGPDDAPDGVRAAYRQFALGELAPAFAAVQAGLAEPASKEAAEAALVEFRRRITRRLEETEGLIASGELTRVDLEGLRRTATVAAAEPELARRAEELAARLSGPELEAEWKAAREMEKLEKKLLDKGPNATLVRSLQKLGEKHPGTKTGARATRLAGLVEEPAEQG